MFAKREDPGRRVLFVCIENSSRSVMAEGFARGFGLDANSAGTFPATHVNPLVVEAMKEVGIDVSKNRPKQLSAELMDEADVVVLTDSSLENAIPRDLRRKMRKKEIRWRVTDPQGKSIEEIWFVRDEVGRLVERLASELSSRQRKDGR